MLEIVVSVIHLTEREAGKIAVAAPIPRLGRAVILFALVLVLLRSGGLLALVAQPVRFARLSVPRLDETRQKRKSPKSSFESHFRVRIRRFRLPCKQFMS